MTIARAVQLTGLGALTCLMMAGGPQSVMVSLVAVVTLAATVTIVAAAPAVLFSLPAWVFRALSVPAVIRDRVPTLARAWWLPTDR